MMVVYGLVQGCAKFYNDSITIDMTDLSNGEGTEGEVCFELSGSMLVYGRD